MSVAAGRPLLRSAINVNAFPVRAEAEPCGRRTCHRASHTPTPPRGHWQSAKSTTTVALALSMERNNQFLQQQPEQRVSRMSRSQRMRLRAEADCKGGNTAAAASVPEAVAGATEPTPLEEPQSRNGSPGAGSSDAEAGAGAAAPMAAEDLGGEGTTAEAQVRV